jgi:hypothetical protein
MDPILPKSLKKAALKYMKQVQDGVLSIDQAEQLIKRQARYSTRTREDIVASLTEKYDEESVQAFQFFRLI